MPTITITGTYYHRTAWTQSNWTRMQLAHGSQLLSSWVEGTFNVQIDTVESVPTTFWVPTDDDDLRAASFVAGQSGGFAYSDGSDFLGKGNYINPYVVVTSINGNSISNGRLYYAGAPDSFPTNDPLNPGAIDRHSLEIVADEDISALVGVTGGETITVVLNYPLVDDPNFGLKVGFGQWTPQQEIGVKVGFSVVIE